MHRHCQAMIGCFNKHSVSIEQLCAKVPHCYLQLLGIYCSRTIGVKKIKGFPAQCHIAFFSCTALQANASKADMHAEKDFQACNLT